MSGKKSGGGNVCRMLGVDLDISHRRNNCGEYDIPVLAGILVESDFDGLEDVYLCRKCTKCFGKFFGNFTADAVFAGEFEHYDMFYHCYFVYIELVMCDMYGYSAVAPDVAIRFADGIETLRVSRSQQRT